MHVAQLCHHLITHVVCHRMSEEVCKSERKMSDLHMELGAETFESWRNEHAAEVLVPVPNHQMEPLL